MSNTKKKHPRIKLKLHPRSKHRQRYDLTTLMEVSPDLKPFVLVNEFGDESINFFDPAAVKSLNKALLKHFYGISNWDIPQDYLCPPIPGRVDYIHYAADLLAGNIPDSTNGIIPLGRQVKCLDIGVGANCVYPFVGNKEYGWSFVGADIDATALNAAADNLDNNQGLNDVIELRMQRKKSDVFNGIIQKGEVFDLTICNPPFHKSLADAQASTMRKLKNLKGKKERNPVLNFGGKNDELWCEGGELQFITTMLEQSKTYSQRCLWFTTLVSKEEHVGKILRQLDDLDVVNTQVIKMGQGQKTSQIIAWTFMNRKQRKNWKIERWNLD